jgi:hypothetical protein
MTTIYLVRHGQASFGAASYDQLSAKGEQQAQVVGDFFKHTLKANAFSACRFNATSSANSTIGFIQSFHDAQFKQNRLGMSLIINKYLPNMNHVLISLNC